jgi:hypothetical protein
MNFGQDGCILQGNMVYNLIPVRQQPEPPDFNSGVRTPGSAFLSQTPDPTKRQWDKNRYWKSCLSDLYRSYDEICAYTGIWISFHGATVDHFLPKSRHPQGAYEWENYRLSCDRANNNKGDSTDVLDPFLIQPDYFVLNFPSLLVKPNASLQADEKRKVERTIAILRLNEECFIQDRLHWLREYIYTQDTHFLRRHAPFIAYELERQHLESSIITMMRV